MSEAHNPLEIINAIEGQLKKVNTQSLDLSFNELLDMKTEGELDISPDILLTIPGLSIPNAFIMIFSVFIFIYFY